MTIVREENIEIPTIVSELKAGKTIVYPTETCYGLGCDATNQQAVDRVFAIKQREKHKSVLIVVPDLGMLYDYIDPSPALLKIAERYWPGPLTVVTQAKPGAADVLADGVVAADGTIAFRITSHPVARALSEGVGVPLVSTSANTSGREQAYDIKTVLAMFEGCAAQPDILIDAGRLPSKSPSTIVRVDHGSVSVLRQGEIVVPPML